MKHRVLVPETGEEFLCAEDQHLLQGMQAFRIGQPMLKVIPVGCRGGGCGICRIRIASGDYEAKKMSIKHVDNSEREQGVALACRVYPRGELVIEIMTPAEQAEQ